jgi:hypothetical protein
MVNLINIDVNIGSLFFPKKHYEFFPRQYYRDKYYSIKSLNTPPSSSVLCHHAITRTSSRFWFGIGMM